MIQLVTTLLTTARPHPQTIMDPSVLGNCPDLCTGYDILWCGISLASSGHLYWLWSLPTSLVYLLTGRAGDTKCLTLDKYYIGRTKRSASNQHYSHTEFKTQHWVSSWEGSNCPSWNQTTSWIFYWGRSNLVSKQQIVAGEPQFRIQHRRLSVCFVLSFHTLRLFSPPKNNWCRIQLSSGCTFKTLGIKNGLSAEKLNNIEELI